MLKNNEKKKLSKNIGEKNIESSLEGTKEGYLIGRKISMVVNKTLEITPWESKCLVRAVTAKKMMKKEDTKQLYIWELEKMKKVSMLTLG